MRAAINVNYENIKLYKPVYSDPHSIISGNLSASITRDPNIIKQAQILRYKIFYEEMGGTPPHYLNGQNIDEDSFDFHCDHLVVFDHSNATSSPRLIGTYRLLGYSDMKKAGKFYSQSEYDISCLLKSPENILELGRSCVDAEYRNGNVIQLLWKCIISYLIRNNISVLFGCASFAGIDANKHALGLSYLHHYHLAKESLRPIALDEVKADFHIIPIDKIDVKNAFNSLPPLIKGYLRIGCQIGFGAVTDKQCNTTDVCIVLDMNSINKRYSDRLLRS